MKVLVVGSLPPPAGEREAWLLGAVLSHREQGAEVRVVSPRRLGVAHRYLTGPSLALGLEIARAARGHDQVLVQLEPGLPVRLSAGRPERTAALLALAAVLRKSQAEVVVRLRHGDDLAGGPGGRAAISLWTAATRIEVGDDETARQIVAACPAAAERISVEPAAAPIHSVEIDGWGEGSGVTAESVMALVRSRAAAEREELAGRGLLGLNGSDPSAPRVAQWQWLPTPGVGVPYWSDGPEADRPAGSLARRAMRAALVAADRRRLTRPVARGARLARELVAKS